MQELKQLSQHCVEAIKQLGEYIAENKRRVVKGGDKNSTTMEKIVCWKCKKRGHYQRDCKKRWSGGVGTVEDATPKPFQESGRKSAAVLKAPTEVYKTGSLSSTCNGLVAEGNIEGSDCHITIDTGSNISIVRPDVLQRSSATTSIQPVNSCLKTLTGEEAPIRGKGQLNLQIGTYVTPHEIWVADITDECIVGLDFLERHGCQVDLKEGVLHIGNSEVPLQKPQEFDGAVQLCCRAVVDSGIHLPPLSENIVPAKLINPNHADKWGLLEREQEAPLFGGLMIGRALVNLQQEIVPVRILNLSDQPRKLNQGVELAVCKSVTCILSNDTCMTEANGDLPNHVQSLYERSITALELHQYSMVSNLLCEYAYLFSRGPEDLGRTDSGKA